MSHRRFHPDNDAADAVRAQWLAPHERLEWIVSASPVFKMTRRRKTGKLKRPLPVRILLWTIGLPIYVFVYFASGAHEDAFDSGSSSAPTNVFAFGAQPHCQAAAVAGLKKGFWVLTDQRFAYLQAVSEEDAANGSRLGKLQRSADRLRKEFASPSLPPEQVRLKRILEFARHQLPAPQLTERKLSGSTVPRAIYERFLLQDGSGFDFYRGPAQR
ncbi:hypothetical protein [Stackebrandtia soli]|uniref:hypothetical protein n=1 Tax=Stackebrandtia soli TaxID=1892856 RepID=UPI0039EA9475